MSLFRCNRHAGDVIPMPCTISSEKTDASKRKTLTTYHCVAVDLKFSALGYVVSAWLNKDLPCEMSQLSTYKLCGVDIKDQSKRQTVKNIRSGNSRKCILAQCITRDTSDTSSLLACCKTNFLCGSHCVVLLAAALFKRPEWRCLPQHSPSEEAYLLDQGARETIHCSRALPAALLRVSGKVAILLEIPLAGPFSTAPTAIYAGHILHLYRFRFDLI